MQNNIMKSTITGEWEWSLCHSSNYEDSTSINDMFSQCGGDYIMLGAGLANDDSLALLAAAMFSDITTYTAKNETHAANGSQWYFNGLSMGFAGIDDLIEQNAADIEGIDENDRLSWHTSTDGAEWEHDLLTPVYVLNGWRAGSEIDIYEGTDWMRYVYTYSSSLAIPVHEPYSLGIFMSALALMFVRRNKI
ncbi:hypothetical protein N7931_17815 [Catenovulum sp. 2E275]|uniref:hypothetical protein n=1 Tax=Catenovulum sp. 2E275 TaxID=2980497 RepID=UPI0021CF550C|nr:hypothetical protein [Catenovulum sp. 2E275]MCU4677483.1 hypothetical protein [Catenovulum sp. 2E275]